MARFSVLIFVLALLLSSADGWAAKNGLSTVHDNQSCGYYLDAYSRSTLEGGCGIKGPHQAWGVFGWIDGYLTAYNELKDNGKDSILGSMSMNDARRWIAAWCRDNPSGTTLGAIATLTGKLER